MKYLSTALLLTIALPAYALKPIGYQLPKPEVSFQEAVNRTLPANQQIAIVEAVKVIRAWNPEANDRALTQTFTERVQRFGIQDGLLRPLVVLMDAAVLAHQNQVAAVLLPTISRIDIPAARSISKKLNVLPIDMDSPTGRGALESLRNATVKMLESRYGDGARESMAMPDLISDWKKFDPSGVSAVLFGPGSFIHGLSASEENFNPQARSPIMGLSMNDVQQCYSRCIGAAKHGATVGKGVGTKWGETGGAVVGSAAGIPGALAGLAIGKVVGPDAGEAIGGALGWGMCARKSCAGGSDEKPSVPPKTEGDGTTSGGTQPAPAPEPKPESKPEPAPTPPEPKPETPAPAEPPKSDGGSGGNCRPGDKDCSERINPDVGPDDGGDSTSDTHRVRVQRRSGAQRSPSWVRAKAPVVNPSRDPMVRGGG